MAGTFFPYLLAFGYVGLFIMIGVFLRAKVGFLQKALVPSSLIGGTLGFICINLGLLQVPTPTGWAALEPGAFGVMVFHLFAIGFVGIGLLKSSGTEGTAAERTKIMMRGSLWMALMFSLLYSIQSLTGFSVFSLWRSITGGGDDPIIGFLLGTGFSQGPGQTIAFASIYEGAPYHVSNAVNIGMTFAALGFFAATIIGVPLARYGLKKCWTVNPDCAALPDYFVRGLMKRDEQTLSAKHTTHPANIDTFAFHFAIIFFLYLLAYFFGIGWMRVMPGILAPLGLGFIFMWGMVFGKIARAVTSRLQVDYVFDEETIRRFTGMCVDLMVASVFMSIEFGAIKGMLIPIAVSVIIVCAITPWLILYLARRNPELGFERFLLAFGTCTGTVATGLLLLRMVDPNFETTVAEEAGMWNILAQVTAAHIMYLAMPFAAVALVPGINMPGWLLSALVFLAAFFIILAVLKVCKLWEQPKF